ncbi:MAG TPA: coproporphyrinogen III oxidase family protein, partial [Leptospiraceae bacterium]|nr:coproporphyrinogen III oxidase family protein [Leptospiraceae bacterium]
ECNPEDLTAELLRSYSEAGITRINAGVQSFSPVHLKTLDRHYRGEKYGQILEILKNSPFSKKGIDLIYGIPGQTMNDFFSDVKTAAENGLSHISAYSLTAEKGTEYYRKIGTGQSLSPNEELQSEILHLLPKFLSDFNYRQYEVSNYSISGYESFHNLKYWLMEEYLGIGPGAHGFIGNRRYSNVRSTDVYLRMNWSSDSEISNLPAELALCLFRIFIPIRLNGFLDRFLPEKKDPALSLIENWKNEGYCTWENGVFEWKQRAVLYLDDRISEFAGL